jgi:hypothetical protein
MFSFVEGREAIRTDIITRSSSIPYQTSIEEAANKSLQTSIYLCKWSFKKVVLIANKMT